MDGAAIDPRGTARERSVRAAARLLAEQGRQGVTTRSVALAAGIQAPTLYRLFGDKDGLLEAVAEQAWSDYVGSKRVEDDVDPVEALHAGFLAHVEFGLRDPELFRLMHASGGRSRAVAAGLAVLAERVRRVARAGRLRVSEERAALLLDAAGSGVVLALLDDAPEARDAGLADAAWDAVSVAVVAPRDGRGEGEDPTRAAAVTLAAAVDDLAALSAAERRLLTEWLHRISG